MRLIKRKFLSLGKLNRELPHSVRQPGYLLSKEEAHRLCAPASRRVCPYRSASGDARASLTMTGNNRDVNRLRRKTDGR